MNVWERASHLKRFYPVGVSLKLTNRCYPQSLVGCKAVVVGYEFVGMPVHFRVLVDIDAVVGIVKWTQRMGIAFPELDLEPIK